MKDSFKALGHGLARAEIAFTTMTIERTSCSEEEAHEVFCIYIKNKLMKTDAIHGSYHVKHGAYLDDYALEQALKMVRDGESKI
jgi:hypothetical protein